MDDEEAILSGRRARRRWLIVLGTLPIIGVIGVGVWIFLDARQHAENTVLVERVTGAAFGCVASIRGDAPEVWGLERALEHMSRMARVTRDREDPTTLAERQRFGDLAADAARGCEELGDVMREAHRADALYFAVPAPLATLVDEDQPERWFRRVLPETRPATIELTRQIRTMAETINQRRTEYELMVQDLPVEGRGPSELARIIEVAPPPRDREREPRTEVWPTPSAIVVLRRGSIASVPCDIRHVSPESCRNEFLQHVTWEGEVGEQLALERPSGVLYWSSFTPFFDGSFWAVGVAARGRGIVGRYPPDRATPELGPIDAPIDATARIIAVTGGVAVFPSDGSSWMTGVDGIAFERVETTPPPLIVRAGSGGAGRGIEIEEQGTLSVFGSAEGGFTSRLEVPGREEDVLLRMIDAYSRVRAVVDLRSLHSGRTVALLWRFNESPDAIAITNSFGRSWLAATDGGAVGRDEPAPR